MRTTGYVGTGADRAAGRTRAVGHVRALVLLGLVLLLAVTVVSCGKPSDPFEPGANMNQDPSKVFAKLMQRPDIDQATQHYQRMGHDIRHALSQAIPELSPWKQDGDISGAGCGSNYPGIDTDGNNDGETRSLPDHVVSGNLADAKYEHALTIIGSVAEQYGFTPRPQRLHDAPGSHDAVFHNVHDDGEVWFGTDKNTLLGIDIGCHLTAAAKRRGHLAPSPTY